MNDDTDTMLLPDIPAGAGGAQPAKAQGPDNTFLVVSSVLFTGVAAALTWWFLDPKMSHAQVALISSVVLVIGATFALSLHFVRLWVRASEGRVLAEIQAVGKRGRCLFYDLSSDIAATNGEIEAMKALLGDFIKRYPPVEGHDESAEVRKARSEGYVEGVRERLSGASHVVGWPARRES